MKNNLLFASGWFAVFSLCLLACEKPESKPVTLTIFAGSSLRRVLIEIKKSYIQEKPNISLNYNINSSGDLQKQIEAGAVVDIFMTANAKFMDDLQSKGYLLPQTRQNFLSNRMVLITTKDYTGVSNFKDLISIKVKKVALADSKVGSSGRYASEVITSFGILEQVKAKAIWSRSSADTMNFLSRGDADAGIVLASEAIESSQVKIVAIAPEKSHSPIIYPVAVLKNSKNISEANEFIQFLQSEQAKAIFVKYGFASVDKI